MRKKVNSEFNLPIRKNSKFNCKDEKELTQWKKKKNLIEENII